MLKEMFACTLMSERSAVQSEWYVLILFTQLNEVSDCWTNSCYLTPSEE